MLGDIDFLLFFVVAVVTSSSYGGDHGSFEQLYKPKAKSSGKNDA